MKTINYGAISIFLLLIVNVTLVVEATAESAKIGLSEQFIIESENVGDKYLIQVAEPIYFAPPETGSKVPVIYVIDGYAMFGPVSSAARMMAWEALSEYSYVVAIGYPTDDQLELNRLRTRDLVHDSIPNIALGASGGGGAKFEAFLSEELLPYIQQNYPVDPEKTVLLGHSLGGLFAATVLKNNPDAFNAYLIGSPSIQIDPSLTNEIQAMAEHGNNRHVFIGVGELEEQMLSGVNALEAALESPKSTFDVQRVTFDNETHTSVIGVLISHGLRHTLSPVAL